jgi:hypothetical protein
MSGRLSTTFTEIVIRPYSEGRVEFAFNMPKPKCEDPQP